MLNVRAGSSPGPAPTRGTDQARVPARTKAGSGAGGGGGLPLAGPRLAPLHGLQVAGCTLAMHVSPRLGPKEKRGRATGHEEGPSSTLVYHGWAWLRECLRSTLELRYAHPSEAKATDWVSERGLVPVGGAQAFGCG